MTTPKSPWDNAPPWARYRARDSDGVWFFYSDKPVPAIGGRWSPVDGMCKVDDTPDWTESLEERP